MSIPDKVMKLKDGKILYDDLRERVEDVKSDVENKYTKPASGIPASDLAETYLTSETDPTVPAWAKASTKPTYTAAEVGALPDNTAIPSKTSDLTNDSNFVQDASYVHTDSNYTAAEKSKLEGIAAGAEVNVNADWNAASGDAAILNKPTNVSAFTNDAGYITDPTVIIDDTAGTGDTDKVWSADKVLSELSSAGTVQDVQINSTSIVSSGVANIQKASSNNLGVVGIEPQSGVIITSSGKLELNPASTADIKKGENTNKPIVPFKQDVAAFYGLATAAGDSTQSSSSNEVGTYTDSAKTAIRAMLGAISEADANSLIATAIGSIETFDVEIVQSLPVSNIKEHTIYFVPKTSATNDAYDEYIYINNAWELIGSTEIDLSNYALKSELPTNVSDLTNDANYVASSALADVATSGSYNDLEDTPTIPTVPTNVSAFTNDAGYLTQHQDISGKVDKSELATVATSGSYTDLSNTPTIPTVPTNVSAFTNDAGYLTQHQDISGKANIADLATVATSGSYNDLTNKPTIPTVPTAVSAFTNDAGYLVAADISGKADTADLADVALSGSYDDLTDTPTIPTVPTNVSAFTNDAGYLTSHQSISGKADKVTSATSGNFAALDSNGNLTDSGHKHSDYLTSHQDITGKADKVSSATNGNFASLDSNGNLVDSGHKHSDYLTSVPNMTGATSSANGAAGLVPAPTTSDTEKFLRGDGTWQLGGKPMVILSYGNSTWQEFLDAYNNNVIVYCRASSNSNPASGTQGRMAFMAYTSGTPITEVEFQYYRSASTHGADTASDQVFVYKLNSSSQWSVITRETGIKQIKPADGSPISVSYSSNIVTLDATVPTLTDLLDDTAGVGDTTVTWSADKIATELAGAGSVSDVQINGTSILSSGIANITTATTAQVKAGTSMQHPLTPGHQHEATFYGLAMAAGDTTQYQSSNTVGTYTDQAKAAIQSMLGVEPGLKVVRLI